MSDSSLQDVNKHENQIHSPAVSIPQQLQQLEYWSSNKCAVDTTQKGVGENLWGAIELIGKCEGFNSAWQLTFASLLAVTCKHIQEWAPVFTKHVQARLDNELLWGLEAWNGRKQTSGGIFCTATSIRWQSGTSKVRTTMLCRQQTGAKMDLETLGGEENEAERCPVRRACTYQHLLQESCTISSLPIMHYDRGWSE